MQPKPELYASEYGAWFQDPLVVAAYPARPPYPAEVFTLLAELVVDEPRAVLDVGCGTGDIARNLAGSVQRIDAVDASGGMLDLAHSLPGGDVPTIRWIHARVEDAVFEPPYALITAGESLHWLEWDEVMPRFARALTPRGVLAIVDRDWDGPPSLHARLVPIFRRYGQVRVYQNVNLLDELRQRGLFSVTDQRVCGPSRWTTTVDEYVLARHSQRSFSRTHMGAASAAEFDAEIREAIAPLVVGDRLELEVGARVTWGRPQG